MRRIFLALTLTVLLGAMLSGCAALGGDSSSNSGTSSSAEYYYDEFPDVAIPQGMDARKERFLTYSQSGVKVGIEEFSGRIEMTSLVNAMQQYMMRDGWQLRSIFRAKRSIIVFEKSDRICTLLITDGAITSDLLVFVSPKLPDGAVQYSAPATAPMQSAPASNPGVQSYPSGGFSNTGDKPLSQ